MPEPVAAICSALSALKNALSCWKPAIKLEDGQDNKVVHVCCNFGRVYMNGTPQNNIPPQNDVPPKNDD